MTDHLRPQLYARPPCNVDPLGDALPRPHLASFLTWFVPHPLSIYPSDTLTGFSVPRAPGPSPSGPPRISRLQSVVSQLSTSDSSVLISEDPRKILPSFYILDSSRSGQGKISDSPERIETPTSLSSKISIDSYVPSYPSGSLTDDEDSGTTFESLRLEVGRRPIRS